jgi:CHASE2 domain-containing sensor protein
VNGAALIASLALSLALTIALESWVFLLAGKRSKKDWLLLVLVNLLTNPVVVLSYLLFTYYTDFNPFIVLIPLEAFAVLTEGYYYKKHGSCFRRPFLFSLAANVISFGAGELIQLLF